MTDNRCVSLAARRYAYAHDVCGDGKDKGELLSPVGIQTEPVGKELLMAREKGYLKFVRTSQMKVS
jgi:hypothetical protein